MDTTSYLIKQLKILVKKAYYSAEKAHDYALNNTNIPKEVSIAYVLRTSSFITSAEALYHSNFNVLARDEAEELFGCFELFIEELLNSYATSHSLQYTHIHFNELKDEFNSSAFAPPIE